MIHFSALLTTPWCYGSCKVLSLLCWYLAIITRYTLVLALEELFVKVDKTNTSTILWKANNALKVEFMNMYLWDSINWHACRLQWLKSTPKSYRCLSFHVHRGSKFWPNTRHLWKCFTTRALSTKGKCRWFYTVGDVMPLAFHFVRNALSLCVARLPRRYTLHHWTSQIPWQYLRRIIHLMMSIFPIYSLFYAKGFQQ